MEVERDGWYDTNSILARITDVMGRSEPLEWMNPKWLGHIMKRLDFREKRRVHSRVEYRLTPEKVNDMAERMGVT
jgi:hypothetical protein